MFALTKAAIPPILTALALFAFFGWMVWLMFIRPAQLDKKIATEVEKAAKKIKEKVD